METRKKGKAIWVKNFWGSVSDSAKTKLPIYSSRGEEKLTLELFLADKPSFTEREVNLIKFITGDSYTFLVYIHTNEESIGGKFELEKLRLSIPKLEIDRAFTEISTPLCPNNSVPIRYSKGLSLETNFSCTLRASRLSDKHSAVTGALTVSRFFEGCLQDALDKGYEVFVYYQGGNGDKRLIQPSTTALRGGSNECSFKN